MFVENRTNVGIKLIRVLEAAVQQAIQERIELHDACGTQTITYYAEYKGQAEAKLSEPSILSSLYGAPCHAIYLGQLTGVMVTMYYWS